MKSTGGKENPWWDKLNIITVIFVSISLSFTVFFFSPMDIFLGNQKEFFVSADYVVLPMLLMSLTGSIALMAAGFLSFMKRSAYNVVTSLMFGLLLMFYIQMMAFNGDIQLLNGENASYSEISFSSMLNLIIMYIILVLPLIMTTARENSGKSSGIMGFARGKVIPYLSALIFAMQFFGSAGMLAQNGLLENVKPGEGKEQFVSYLSYEPVMKLSEDKNIIVFILDRLDGRWMDELLERYPEMNGRLEGFTYYRNNISAYANTFPSVANMLTNADYRRPESEYDYLDKAWSGETLASKLGGNGYNVNLLIDMSSTYNSISDLSGCGNIAQGDITYSINYFGRRGIIRTMTYMSLTKLMPILLKENFSQNVNSDPAEEFVTSKSDFPDRMPWQITFTSDMKFSDYFGENGLTADIEGKTFSFIHLNGSHGVSNEVSQWYPDFSGEGADEVSTARGEFELLLSYFDVMKELGVYDDSVIMILADHGMSNELSPTTLLIKPEGAEREPLKTDSDTPLSNANFFPSILEYAGIEHSEYGSSYNDIIKDSAYTDRYIWLNHGQHLYKVTGNARDTSNWEELPIDDLS